MTLSASISNKGPSFGSFLKAADTGTLEREFRRPAMLAMLMFYTFLILLFVWMAASEKQNSIEKEGRMARAALAEAQVALVDTVGALSVSAQERTADDLPHVLPDLARRLHKTSRADSILAVTSSGSIISNFGRSAQIEARQLSSELLPLLDRASLSRNPVSGVMKLDGKPWLLAAEQQDGPNGAILVVGNPLDAVMLTNLGSRFGLSDLTWSSEQPVSGSKSGRTRLYAQNGRPLGWLSWTPDQPGHKRILAVMPWLAIAMLVILVLAARILSTWSDALNRLRKRDEQLQAVLRHAADGIVITTTDGRIEAANMAASQLFGLSVEGLTGEYLKNLLRNPQARDVPLPPFALQPLSTGPAIPIELETVAEGRDAKFVEVAVGLIESDGVQMHAVSLRDITAQKDFANRLEFARDAAEAASKAKSEFLASMSHELRTPLNAIIGFSELMAEEIQTTNPLSRHIEYLNDISGSGRHLLGLIEDVLEYAKYETGRMILSDAPCNLSALISDCMDAIRPQTEARGLSLLQLGIVPGMVMADSRKLRAAIHNILSNAVKFTPTGRISLTIEERSQTGLVIIIIDTGIGIDPDQQIRVLDPFFQSDMRLARRYEGIGLGLPLAKAVMELHGGSLELESRPGDGTTVRLILPPSRLMALATPSSTRLHG